MVQQKKTGKKSVKQQKGGKNKIDDESDIDTDTDFESDSDDTNSDIDVVEDYQKEDSEEDLEKVESEEEPIESESDNESDSVKGDSDGDDCLYKLSKKKKNDDDFIVDEEDYFDEEHTHITQKYVPNNERQTKPFLFQYERVRLYGERAKQLSLGAKPMIKNIQGLNSKQIAKLEIEQKVVPLSIERLLPNGLIERWNITELKQI